MRIIGIALFIIHFAAVAGACAKAGGRVPPGRPAESERIRPPDDASSGEEREDGGAAAKSRFLREMVGMRAVGEIIEDPRLTNMHADPKVLDLDRWEYYYDFLKNEQSYYTDDHPGPSLGLAVKPLETWSPPHGDTLAVFIYDGAGYLCVVTGENLDIGGSPVFREKKLIKTAYGDVFKYSTRALFRTEALERVLEGKAVAMMKYQA